MTVKTLVSEKEIDKIVARYKHSAGGLLSILEEVQRVSQFKFLPPETLEYIAKKVKVPTSRIFNVVTFFSFFNLQPQGEHTIVVCRGTACHTRGSKVLLESVRDFLGFDPEELDETGKVFLTTKDNKFTIRTVACFGQCALAPVVEIDGKVYSYLTAEKLRKIIKSISQKKAKAKKI